MITITVRGYSGKKCDEKQAICFPHPGLPHRRGVPFPAMGKEPKNRQRTFRMVPWAFRPAKGGRLSPLDPDMSAGPIVPKRTPEGREKRIAAAPAGLRNDDLRYADPSI